MAKIMVTSNKPNSNKSPQTFYLTDLNLSQSGEVVSINAGQRATQRLSGMGITPGTMVTSIGQAPFNGPIQITVRGSRLAIGRGLAMKIIVVPK